MGTTASLSRSLTERKAAPVSGSRLPAPSQALAKATPKESPTPITSPVDFISGPSTGSTPGKRRKGKTGALTKTPGTGGSAVKPSSASVLPAITATASLTSGTPTALAMKGTVREARGLTSRT